MALIQKAFSDIITFSRSSNATRIGPTGLVEYAPHNLMLQSQTFDNAGWTKTSCTATANAASAPDGTVTADNVITSAAISAVSQSVSISADTKTYTQSVYVKYVSGSVNFRIRSALVGGTSVAKYLAFNAQTGAVVGSDATYTITSVGNGWYRISLSIDNNGTNTSFAYQIYPTNDTTSTNEMSLWGAQLSVGPYPLDYTPTTSAAVYGPRFDYDPVTLAARGLLIEEQRTNQALYAAQFDNATWSKSGISVTANSVVSPDGTVTASTITATNSNGDIYHSTGGTAGTYTASIYVRRKTGTGQLQWVTLDGGRTNVTQTISSTSWTRISYPSTGTLTNNYFGLRIVVSGDEFYIWGAQLEAGSFATSYIPTLASSVTRSADVASVNTLSPWFNATEGALFCEYDMFVASGQPYQAELNDGTANNRITLYANAGVQRTYIATSGAAQVDMGVGSISNNVVYKTAVAYKANDFAITLNGVSPTIDNSGTIPTVSKLALGAYNSDSLANLLNGHLRRIAYYPRRLTNAELQALTA